MSGAFLSANYPGDGLDKKQMEITAGGVPALQFCPYLIPVIFSVTTKSTTTVDAVRATMALMFPAVSMRTILRTEISFTEIHFTPIGEPDSN